MVGFYSSVAYGATFPAREGHLLTERSVLLNDKISEVIEDVEIHQIDDQGSDIDLDALGCTGVVGGAWSVIASLGLAGWMLRKKQK